MRQGEASLGGRGGAKSSHARLDWDFWLVRLTGSGTTKIASCKFG